MADELSTTEVINEAQAEKALKRRSSPRKKESLEDIINAVAEKEDVITAFKSRKPSANKPELADVETDVPVLNKRHAHPFRYLFLQLLGGFFWGIGVFAAVLVFIAIFDYEELRVLNSVFYKFVILLQTFGR